MRGRVVAAALALLLAHASSALAQGAPASGADVEMEWGVRIPMRDGVRLNATVFRPKGQAVPLPVIFTLTPYIADSYTPRALYFARHGYVFALVDVRGRGNSEGTFVPFENEGRDGHDVVEWLAARPFSNGKVAMWGGSYAGYDQWVTLKERPPHLATIVPAAAPAACVDFPFLKGVAYPYVVQWAAFTAGKALQPSLFGSSDFWISKFRELSLAHRPFRELDAVAGFPSAWFQKVLSHPTFDAYWRSMSLAPADYERIGIPILTITGQYDDDQPGALSYYRAHMAQGTGAAKARHLLLVGPWDHAGTRTPSREVGGLTFGPASMVDLDALHLAWYDWTLKDGPRPGFLKKRVTYYVAGEEEWRSADALEEVAAAERTLYLRSDGAATDAFRSGALSEEKPAAEKPDRFVYDPLDVRPASLETEEVKSYLTDQRAVLRTFGNGVVYHGEPLAEDVVTAGSPRLSVWIALDVPDTDLKASLYEVRQDGTSILLGEDLLRARYRESLEKETLVRTGEALRYDFEGFPFVARRLEKGSRLRLFLRCPNTIYLQRNYNSGGVVSNETAGDARVAHVTVLHDATHPSALVLPLAR